MPEAPRSVTPTDPAGDAAALQTLPGWRWGTVLRVPFYVRPSTLVTAGVLWVALFSQLSPASTGLSQVTAGLLAVLTTVGFLASVVLHELAHAVLATSLGLRVHGVSVFYLGGVTQLATEPTDPSDELAIAVAGPLTNLTLAAGLIAVAGALGTDSVAGVLTGFLGEINAAIGVFNLLPGHPLDGGALLRAGLWKRTGDRLRAARTTGLIGQGLAILLIGIGVIATFRPGEESIGGLWIAIVGMFIFTAARTGLAQTRLREQLKGVTVADVVVPSGWSADLDWTVARVVADVTRSQRPGLVLDTGGRVMGAFGPRQLADVPSGSWEHLTVGELSHPVEGTVAPGSPLSDVLPRFAGKRDGWVAVVDGAMPYGVLTIEDVMARLQAP